MTATGPARWPAIVAGNCSHGGHGWDGETCDEMLLPGMPSSALIPGDANYRAERIAQAMTADPEATAAGEDPWTASDVIAAALERGLAALETAYKVKR